MIDRCKIGKTTIVTWYTPEEKAPPENESLYITISGKAGDAVYSHSPATGTFFPNEGWLIDGINPKLSDEGISVDAWCDLMPYGSEKGDFGEEIPF